MLVSHRHKFIYTKTIRTASSSVEAYFEPACREKDLTQFGVHKTEEDSAAGIVGSCGSDQRHIRWYDHMSASEIKQNLPDEQWNEYFKFCTIRNPFDKLVSAYHFYDWLIENTKGWKKAKLIFAHGLIPRRDKNEIKRFRQWLAWTRWFTDQQHYMIDGKICLDFFIRYESLLKDIQTVCNKVNYPFDTEKLPRFNSQSRSRSRKLAEYYDSQAIERVRNRFRFELEYFEYDIPF